MSKKILLAAMLAATLPLAANAAQDTADFGVQLVVNSACTIAADSAVDALDFGSVTGNVGTAISGTTDLTVNCNQGAAYTIGLEGSNGSRTMSNGSETVSYELYQDAAHSIAWGELASGDELGGTGNNADQTITVFGLVPAQAAAVGTYVDTVTATIEF